jgi:hypothetical protein
MSNQDQFVSHDDEHASQEASTAMRTLTIEELREVVGGPIIDNGMGIAATVPSGGK